MRIAPANVDEYLALIPEEDRYILENLRTTIKTIEPKVVEVISYQIPTFRYNGQMLVAFSAHKKHCSLHLMSKALMEEYKEVLKPYVTTKASIHFTADKPLSHTLVKHLIRARIAENQKRRKEKPKNQNQ